MTHMKPKSILAVVCCLMSFMAVNAAQYLYTIPVSGGRDITVDLLSADIVRITNAPRGYKIPASRFAVMKSDKPFNRTVNAGNRQIISTDRIAVEVDKSTGAVTVSGGDNRVIHDSGTRSSSSGITSMNITTMGRCSWYGAGERGHAFNMYGDTLVNYNRQNYEYKGSESRISQMNITMPLMVSSAGYALLFDDFAPSAMILGNPVEYLTESHDPVSYYFINGNGTLAGTTEQYTALTGRQDLAPLWSLGYITSKYGYRTQAETEGVIDTLKREGYPVDGIVLDLYWYGKEQDMGRYDWDPAQWPDHRRMLADLSKKGVHTVIINQPYVLGNGYAADNLRYLDSKGMLVRDSLGRTHPITIWVGEGGMLDVSNPDTRRWLTDRYAALTREGVGGWWGDLGEPEVHPKSAMHANGLTARQYHNIYGNDWAEIIHKMYRDSFPDTRLMTLMRGGTAGLQRHSVFPWSTDVSRSWGGLEPQVRIMLNSGLSGLGYMSHDVGGFAIDRARPTEAELYVRWLQLGLFSPILRTHAQYAAEPYNYPHHADLTRRIIKDRYRWLPYNYTLAYQNATHGWPLVRPLNFTNPSDTRYDDISDEYMWGPDVLVAPVLTAGTVRRQVVFPSGTWLSYYDPSRVFHGGDSAIVSAPLSQIPLFVRAGSVIPMANYSMENTTDYTTARYTLDYFSYPDTESSFALYEDDLHSPDAISRKEYALVDISARTTAGGHITVSLSRTGSYPGLSVNKRITLVIRNTDSKPSRIALESDTGMRALKSRDIKYDAVRHMLTFSFDWNSDEPVTAIIN